MNPKLLPWGTQNFNLNFNAGARNREHHFGFGGLKMPLDDVARYLSVHCNNQIPDYHSSPIGGRASVDGGHNGRIRLLYCGHFLRLQPPIEGYP
jgi:hypothetical protein